MREYGQIQSSFWTDHEIQGLSDQAIRLACYLLTGPHTTSLGCFRLPNGYVQEDFQWDSEMVSKAFLELLEVGFIYRCSDTFWVLIPNFLRWNPVANPNVAKKLEKDFKVIPKNITIYNQLAKSIKRYGKHFSNGFVNGLERVLADAEEPYRNKDPDPDPDPDPDLFALDDHGANEDKSTNFSYAIELPLNTGSHFVTQADVDKWQGLYQAVDVMQQLRAMAGWLDANKSRRKTKNGIARFINSWLTKEQDKPRGNVNATHSQDNRSRAKRVSDKLDEIARRDIEENGFPEDLG